MHYYHSAVQARLWQVGKLMPQKLARHMEVSSFHTIAIFESELKILLFSSIVEGILGIVTCLLSSKVSSVVGSSLA